MDRRRFLERSGAAVGAAVVLSNCSTPAAPPDATAAPEIGFDTWEKIRNQFLLSRDKVHMSQMLLASHPKPVRDAIEMYRTELDNNPVEYWEGKFVSIEGDLRKKAAEYMGCDPDEVAMTDSTTMGLAILYNGLQLRQGDEILSTTHDHYSTEKSLENAVAKTGATIKRVSLYTDPREASIDRMVSALQKGITAKTRIVAITYVHSSTGVKTPLKEIGAMIAGVNANRETKSRIYFCVDGVHGFGIENISMHDMEVDFFAAGTHKWIFGPRGTGVLYARKSAQDMIKPIIPSFEFASYGAWLDLVDPKTLTYGMILSPGGFHSFEHRWALPAAFDFQLSIGKARVEERSHQLSTRLKEGLSKMGHIKLKTPMDIAVSAGINCFEVDGVAADVVVKKLLEKGIIASTTPYKTVYARLTPSIVNSEEEVDRALAAIEQIRQA